MRNRRTIATIIVSASLIAWAGLAVASAALAFDGTPKLAVPIPTISLTDVTKSKDGDLFGLPWIAEYITGVYRYSVGLGSLVGTVMIVIGGFQYLTAGGDAGRVKAGKQRITDAVIGMLLLVGSYVILYTVNPDLVSLGSVVVKQIRGQEAKMILAAGGDGGGFAPPDAYSKPFNPQEAPALLPPSDASTAAPATPSQNTANVQTDKADEAFKNVPPPEFPQLFDGDVPDLYKTNEYGTVVSGETRVAKMNSICVSRLKNKGPSDVQSVLKRAAAITRVWIVEGVYNGGALYYRGANADFWFIRNAFRGTDAVAQCMRGRASAEDLDQCDINAKKCPVSDYQAVYSSLQQAYAGCKLAQVKKQGFSLGHCTDWVLSLATCALGAPPGGWKSEEKNATLRFPTGNPIMDLTLPKGVSGAAAENLMKNPTTWAKMKIDPKYWLDAIKTVGGPKPFDLYHLGKAAYSPLCHTVMYIGGMNLKGPKGEPIYWIEMGGGGAADLGGPRTLTSGKTGCPTGEGIAGCGTGASIHFNPYINSHNSLAGIGGGCYFKRATLNKEGQVVKDQQQVMVRLLDRIQQ